MNHCSYQLSPLMTSKKVCLRHRTEAHLEDLTVENLSDHTPKRKLSICRNCPIRKRLAFSHSVDSNMTLLV